MQKCHSCSRVGDDIGKCGSTLTCPQAGRPIDPTTDIVIHCDVCDITRAVSVDTLMKHREPRLDNACQTTECKAFILRPKETRLGDPPVVAGASPFPRGGAHSTTTAKAPKKAAPPSPASAENSTQDAPKPQD